MPERKGIYHSERYLEQTAAIARVLLKQAAQIEGMAGALRELRERKGRLFLAGVGGGGAQASHAAADFRRLCGIDAHAVTDTIAEFTALINDEGWKESVRYWLEQRAFSGLDAVMVLSVGGGSPEHSPWVELAMQAAWEEHATVLGIVGRDGGVLGKNANWMVKIPVAEAALVTMHVEGFQSVLLHLLVSHPALKIREAAWESSR